MRPFPSSSTHRIRTIHPVNLFYAHVTPKIAETAAKLEKCDPKFATNLPPTGHQQPNTKNLQKEKTIENQGFCVRMYGSDDGTRTRNFLIVVGFDESHSMTPAV